MTLAHFRQLLPAQQVRFTLHQGTYLMQRIHRTRGLHLYYIATAGLGFFVELSFSPVRETIVPVRSFEHLALLHEYVTGVCLPAHS